jgi:hypothetical protein
LAQYYLDAGHQWEPRITVPAGSYVPEFHLVPSKPEEPVPAPLRQVEAVSLADLGVPQHTNVAIMGSRRRLWPRWLSFWCFSRLETLRARCAVPESSRAPRRARMNRRQGSRVSFNNSLRTEFI